MNTWFVILNFLSTHTKINTRKSAQKLPWYISPYNSWYLYCSNGAYLMRQVIGFIEYIQLMIAGESNFQKHLKFFVNLSVFPPNHHKLLLCTFTTVLPPRVQVIYPEQHCLKTRKYKNMYTVAKMRSNDNHFHGKHWGFHDNITSGGYGHPTNSWTTARYYINTKHTL